MEVTVKDNNVSVVLPERISEVNAGEVNEELNRVFSEHKGENYALDCAELEYISSSGLRAILNVQKKLHGHKVILYNVSRAVNEILEMTGFDNIFSIYKRMKQISIEGKKAVSSGINGDLYRLEHDMMLKVYRRGISITDVENEREMSKKALVCGIPTAISFSTVKVGEDRYGIIFENIKGESIADIIKKDPTEWIELSYRWGRFVKSLHDISIEAGLLPSIKDRYRGWLDEIKDRAPMGEITSMRNLVDSAEGSNTFIHGDMNPCNVFLVDDEFLIMDMASCGYGHPIFDLQAIYASLVTIELDNEGYTEKTFGLDKKKCIGLWNTFLRGYLGAAVTTPGGSILGENGEGVEAISDKKLSLLLTQYYILKEKLINNL
ncbi:MAG: STAS domain-containing protein [Eubacterium sp.]|nr:STAS domain-containing protein [Eubacterium sp.]